MSAFTLTFTVICVTILAAIFAWVMFWWLYRRATKETSFVRTGFGGQKVVVNGGALVIPVLHDTINVDMSTVGLEISRSEQNSIITRDRMRVDMTVEFYVRVKSSPESISLAAQTIGSRAGRAEPMREILEGRLVDALRTATAEMTMEELHEQRGKFITGVKKLVSAEIDQIGLELESASLTVFDQTERTFFNPNNVFDAEGLTRLINEIEERRMKRNEIEQETEVKIQKRNLEAETQKLSIAKEEEFVRLAQEKDIAIRRAEQRASIAAEEAARRREAHEAEIQATISVDIAKVQSKQHLELEQLALDQALQTAKTETQRSTVESTIKADHTVDAARVQSRREIALQEIAADIEIEQGKLDRKRAIAVATIKNDNSIDQSRIEHEKNLALSTQQCNIDVAQSSLKEVAALTAAEETKQVLVKAEEELTTLRATEREKRTKLLELIQANSVAEKATVKTQSDTARLRAIAEAEADSEKMRAVGADARNMVEAKALAALNDADNLLSSELIEMKVRLSVIENLKDIIHESVKPLANIDGIKIVQVDGITNNQGGGNGDAQGGVNLTDSVVNSALRYRAQAPIVDALLAEVGFDSGDQAGLSSVLTNPFTGTTAPPSTADSLEHKD